MRDGVLHDWPGRHGVAGVDERSRGGIGQRRTDRRFPPSRTWTQVAWDVGGRMVQPFLKLPDLRWMQVYYLLLIEAELIFGVIFLLNRLGL